MVSSGEFLIQAPATVVYVVAAIAMAAVIRRQPPTARRYSSVVLAVVVVSAVGMALQTFNIAEYPSAIQERPLSGPQFVDDSVAYATLFGMVTYTAGASRRMIALVSGLSLGSRVMIEVGSIFGGLMLSVGVLASLSSFGIRIYLLWWPVWQSAKEQPERRRLLYWKGRNTLMLLIGVNILTGILSTILLDNFVQLVLINYIDVMIRIGFAGFLLSNVAGLMPEKAVRQASASETVPG